MKNFSLIKKILLGLLLVVVASGVFVGIKLLNTKISSSVNKNETNQEISNDDNNTENNEDNTPTISEVALCFDSDYITQLTAQNSNITRSTIRSMSFLKSSDKKYLMTLNSGIKVYYSGSGLVYDLDFVADKIYAPTSCRSLFQNCIVTSLDFSNFDTSNAVDMDLMFQNCSNLAILSLSNFDTRNVTSSSLMFAGCDNLISVTVGENYTLDNLPEIKDDTTNDDEKDNKNDNEEDNPTAVALDFDYDYITQLSAHDSNITKNTTTSMSFLQSSNKEHLMTLNSGIDVYYSANDNNKYELDFVADKIYAPEKCLTLFGDCSALTSLDLSNFDTSKVTDMGSMFLNCEALTTLVLSNFDTSNVINMGYMFYGCKALTSLDLSNFDTSKVTDMYCMFNNCFALTSLDLSNFNTSNVTEMGSMFLNCEALTTLVLSNFDTSNVINMGCMFYGCKALTSLDLSNFDTSNVTYMSFMFYGCKTLTSLDLSNFDTGKCVGFSYYQDMFYGCEALTSVTVGENYTLNNLPV